MTEHKAAVHPALVDGACHPGAGAVEVVVDAVGPYNQAHMYPFAEVGGGECETCALPQPSFPRSSGSGGCRPEGVCRLPPMDFALPEEDEWFGTREDGGAVDAHQPMSVMVLLLLRRAKSEPLLS